MKSQLGQDVLDVVRRCFVRNHQRATDLMIRESLRHELGNLQLSTRQLVAPGRPSSGAIST
jgi:hypothetical protein